MTATVETTENRSKKISKERKNHRCDNILLHIKKKRTEANKKRKEKKNLRIKRDNINIEEQFYAMPNMLPSFRSWNYAREKKILKDLFPLSLYFHPIMLCRYATVYVIN
jgi:CO dehydrogenase/acetyl-CoA synthase gamma subunit (corrinoid Fe-S protein)